MQNNYLVFVTQDRVNQEYYLEIYRPDVDYCWCRRMLFKTQGIVSVVACPDSTRRYAVVMVEVCDTTSGKIQSLHLFLLNQALFEENDLGRGFYEVPDCGALTTDRENYGAGTQMVMICPISHEIKILYQYKSKKVV